ncbi:MAG: type II secretion system protein GspD, partial [Bacteroidota bacterium]
KILTRSFQSIIRVKDGETVVLGGLTREATGRNTDGLPIISRIPVLKWIFGTNQRSKSKSSLIIYITPTVYYN